MPHLDYKVFLKYLNFNALKEGYVCQFPLGLCYSVLSDP